MGDGDTCGHGAYDCVCHAVILTFIFDCWTAGGLSHGGLVCFVLFSEQQLIRYLLAQMQYERQRADQMAENAKRMAPALASFKQLQMWHGLEFGLPFRLAFS